MFLPYAQDADINSAAAIAHTIMTPIISSSDVMETPNSVSGSMFFSKKKVASTRDIYLAWFAAAHLIRAFFVTYSVGESGVQEQSGDPQKIRPVCAGTGPDTERGR